MNEILISRSCGLQHPVFWMVPHRVWRHYVKQPDRDARLCLVCWETLVQRVDGGAFQNRYGKPAIIDKRIDQTDTARGLRRYRHKRLGKRLVLIGFDTKDWRLVQKTLLAAATSKDDRVSILADLIGYELRHR
jgi:hypothetical protein